MTPTAFDAALLAAIAAFAALGALSGARAQLKALFALAFALMTALPLASALPPIAAPYLGVSPESLKLRLALFALSFFVLLCGGVFLFEKLDLNVPGRGEKAPAWDRAAGLLLGASKSAFGLYAALCAALLFESPLAASLGKPPEAVAGSRAVAFVRANALFGTDVPPELRTLADAVQDPLEARRRLEAEMKKALDEASAAPNPTPQNLALAAAIKSGDLSALSKDPRFARLLKSTGADAALKPADVDAMMRVGREK